MPDRSSRYLLDNNIFIAAVKHKWTKSTELIYHLLDSPVELFANDLLIFEYEKYAITLGTYELLNGSSLFSVGSRVNLYSNSY